MCSFFSKRHSFEKMNWTMEGMYEIRDYATSKTEYTVSENRTVDTHRLLPTITWGIIYSNTSVHVFFHLDE